MITSIRYNYWTIIYGRIPCANLFGWRILLSSGRPMTSLRAEEDSACALEPVARDQMIIDHADGLHESVAYRRADELKPPGLKRL